MGVRADQRALLELLLKHSVDYETIGAVLSTGPDGARARARAALSSIAGGDAEVDEALADFLLGRAVASERTRTVQSLASDAEANALARRIVDGIRAEFEGVEPPHIPSLHPAAEAAASPNGDAVALREGRPKRRSRVRTVLRVAVAIVIAAAVALAITLALPAEETGDGTEAGEETSLTEIEDRIPLQAPDGDGASGEAVIGFRSETEPYLELDFRGLAPAPEGQVHLLWIEIGEGKGLPMPPPIPIGANGAFRDRLGLPLELLAALDQGESLNVIVIPPQTLRELRRGFDAGVGTDLTGVIDELPPHPGGTVLEGEIPPLESAAATD